jgi:hypothetical protein
MTSKQAFLVKLGVDYKLVRFHYLFFLKLYKVCYDFPLSSVEV